jgi:hypothetical protein
VAFGIVWVIGCVFLASLETMRLGGGADEFVRQLTSRGILISVTVGCLLWLPIHMRLLPEDKLERLVRRLMRR